MGRHYRWLLGHSAGMLQGSSAVPNPGTGSWPHGWMGKWCLGEMLHKQSKTVSHSVGFLVCLNPVATLFLVFLLLRQGCPKALAVSFCAQVCGHAEVIPPLNWWSPHR